MEEDVLLIEARTSPEKKQSIQKFFRLDFGHHSFQSKMLLPENIQNDKMTARYEDGILVVTIPKSKEPILATKEINII